MELTTIRRDGRVDVLLIILSFLVGDGDGVDDGDNFGSVNCLIIVEKPSGEFQG